MGYYGEQLKKRMEQDQLSVKRNKHRLADTVSSRRLSMDESVGAEPDNLRQIEKIADYFGLKVPPYQLSGEALPEQIDLILHPAGIMKRSILLDGPWWKDGDGPILVRQKGQDRERILALFPDIFRGYCYRDTQTNQKIRITQKDGSALSHAVILCLMEAETSVISYRPECLSLI